jgi:hypothetical protein
VTLIFHGSVILLGGLLCGAPFGSAVVRGKPEATVRAWRVAHSGIVMGGIMLLVIGLVLPHLRLGDSARQLLIVSFVASGYGFTVALPLGAHDGQRGLTADAPLVNRVVYLGNMIGAIGSLIGTLVLIWGAYAAL